MAIKAPSVLHLMGTSTPTKIVADDRVPQFLADALGVTFHPPFAAMGLEREGRICAGALFNCFGGGSINLTAAGSGWTRGFLDLLQKSGEFP